MSYLTALYDNFEIFQKKIQWGRIFENREAVREISTDFHLKTVFNSQNIGESSFDRRGR